MSAAPFHASVPFYPTLDHRPTGLSLPKRMSLATDEIGSSVLPNQNASSSP